MFIAFREKGRERDRERETSIGCLLYEPWPGIEPATQVCALTGNETHHLWLYRVTLQPTEPPSQNGSIRFYVVFLSHSSYSFLRGHYKPRGFCFFKLNNWQSSSPKSWFLLTTYSILSKILRSMPKIPMSLRLTTLAPSILTLCSGTTLFSLPSC